MVTGTL